MNTLTRIALLAPLALIPFAAGAVETHTVTISAYVDGNPATTAATSANGDSFPMTSQWSAKNLGHGTGFYPLDPSGFNSSSAYTAVTSPMDAGAKYTTRALVSHANDSALVSSDCKHGKKYMLEGYSLGETLDDAEDAGPSDMNWARYTGIQSDKHIIVWFRHCLEAPQNVSPKNGKTFTTSQLTKVDWTDVSSAYGDVSYYYESSLSKTLSGDGSFQNPIYESGELSESEIPTPGTPPGTYYWHAKAVDSAGNESPWGNAFKVHVTADPI